MREKRKRRRRRLTDDDDANVEGVIHVRMQVGEPDFRIDESFVEAVRNTSFEVGKPVNFSGLWDNSGAGRFHNYMEIDVVDVTEDEVFNQQSFKRAHAYCCAALIFEMQLQLDAAEAMRERCKELLDIALRSVTLDLDGDGVVDEGEENLRRSGGSARDFRASWKTYTKTDYDSRFSPVRGMRH